MPTQEEVAWLHLLKRESYMTAAEIFIAAHEASMIDLAITTRHLNFDTVASIMRGYVTQGKVDEKDVPTDTGMRPAWKLAGEHPETPFGVIMTSANHSAATRVSA